MKKIGEMLVESGVLASADLERALALQRGMTKKKPIGEILVDLDIITIDTLINYLEIQLREKYKC
jgi:hypothetical protein